MNQQQQANPIRRKETDEFDIGFFELTLVEGVYYFDCPICGDEITRLHHLGLIKCDSCFAKLSLSLKLVIEWQEQNEPTATG